jgi:hypothetical protein
MSTKPKVYVIVHIELGALLQASVHFGAARATAGDLANCDIRHVISRVSRTHGPGPKVLRSSSARQRTRPDSVSGMTTSPP